MVPYDEHAAAFFLLLNDSLGSPLQHGSSIQAGKVRPKLRVLGVLLVVAIGVPIPIHKGRGINYDEARASRAACGSIPLQALQFINHWNARRPPAQACLLRRS